ncbi:DNA polymerase X family [hydrothermal vent metagenome]|uniref:DNA polymerase X family n=1 Tax=hydrothermal vent metagenome TaxID=652676 RepID=A0A3B1B744_9ZZZZ
MPVHNEDIAVIFEEMADLLEIENANPFRVRAYCNAARTVRGLGCELSTMVAMGYDLTRLPGIAKDLSAKKRGFRYIAITDYTRNLGLARGLDPERLRQQIEEIDRLNEKLDSLSILKGSEVDILEDGRLDLPNDILSQLDLVIGAVHSKFHLSRSRQTTRICRAMESKYFTLLAHPSDDCCWSVMPMMWTCCVL